MAALLCIKIGIEPFGKDLLIIVIEISSGINTELNLTLRV